MTTLRAWLRERPFRLAMSSGFFGFFAHAGALAALEDEGLLPASVAGASAGALVSGAYAAGMSAARLEEELLALRRPDFWDPWPGLGLLRGRRYRNRLHALFPGRIEACRVPVHMSTFDVFARTTRVLSTGSLAEAIYASTAVPGLFHPAWIDGRPHVDGGVGDRPGLAGVAAGERVLFHHLSSRSPWRRRDSPALAIPRRVGMVAVVLEGLPRVGPFRLGEGVRALDAAKARMSRALDHVVISGVIRG